MMLEKEPKTMIKYDLSQESKCFKTQKSISTIYYISRIEAVICTVFKKKGKLAKGGDRSLS